MQRAASIVWIAFAALVLVQSSGVTLAGETCRVDEATGRIICTETGGGRVGSPPTTLVPGRPPTTTVPRAPLQYVYTKTHPVVGRCHYWSNVPGGLDVTKPSDEAAINAIVATLPLCPSTPRTPSDPSSTAWSIFRSWPLAAPAPTVTPPDHGITGSPTHVAASPPRNITHTETMPDGRVLEVRARPVSLIVIWGDGISTSHRPSEATGYPTGAAAHTYELKTCTQAYRAEHPSGGLCHPTAESYQIVTSYVWQGEYSVGSGWVALGSLERPAPSIIYDVDEARGVSSP